MSEHREKVPDSPTLGELERAGFDSSKSKQTPPQPQQMSNASTRQELITLSLGSQFATGTTSGDERSLDDPRLREEGLALGFDARILEADRTRPLPEPPSSPTPPSSTQGLTRTSWHGTSRNTKKKCIWAIALVFVLAIAIVPVVVVVSKRKGGKGEASVDAAGAATSIGLGPASTANTVGNGSQPTPTTPGTGSTGAASSSSSGGITAPSSTGSSAPQATSISPPSQSSTAGKTPSTSTSAAGAPKPTSTPGLAFVVNAGDSVNPAWQHVAVTCKDANFQGQCVTWFLPDSSATTPLCASVPSYMDNAISSVAVDSGYRCTLFEDSDCSGAHTVFVIGNSLGDTTTGGMDNFISSLTCEVESS